MTPEESVELCKFASQAAPQQKIDQDTPKAWFVLLNDIRYQDAQQGLVRVLQRQPFVAPAEIRAEVKRLRGERMLEFERAHGPLPAPPREVAARGDQAERAWLKNAKRAIADGTVTNLEDLGVRVIPGVPKPLELEGVFKRVPEDNEPAPESAPKPAAKRATKDTHPRQKKAAEPAHESPAGE